jgi:hypothetical protein
VKEQMGHSSIAVTVDIYGHFIPSEHSHAVDDIDDEVSVSTETTSAG